jgi:hypothetical protein
MNRLFLCEFSIVYKPMRTFATPPPRCSVPVSHCSGLQLSLSLLVIAYKVLETELVGTFW